MPSLSNDTFVLASGSATRARMLRAAGLSFTIDAPAIDEDEIRDSLVVEKASGREIAETLAELKAKRVSPRHGATFVLAADQTLTCEGALFAKPRDRDAAARQLMVLSGKTHELASAAVIARDGDVVWHKIDTARLTVRRLSSDFVTRYLDAAGDSVEQTVGAYELEGLGAQLFSRVEGDYFTVLGLPLLSVLDFLRLHRIVPI